MKKFCFKLRGRKISLNVKKVSFFGEVIGLMFSSREKSQALLFDFKKKCRISLHSLFVFYKFLVVWFDENNKIVDVKIVKPFRLSVLPNKKFVKLLEIPVNNKYSKIVKILVGKFRKV